MRRQSNVNYELDPTTVELVPWFREQIVAWFKLNRRSFPWRETNRTPYEIAIAEILLQRTPASSVAKVYDTFLERYPSWTSLSEATSEELEESIKGLGLSRLKAEIFRHLCEAIEIRGGSVPATRSELEQIKGVGQYTSSAILTVLHGLHEPLVDVNMARVLGRFFERRIRSDVRDDPSLHVLARYIVDTENCLQINWAILDLSALICKFTRPLCQECPLQPKCRFAASKLNQVDDPKSSASSS